MHLIESCSNLKVQMGCLVQVLHVFNAGPDYIGVYGGSVSDVEQ